MGPRVGVSNATMITIDRGMGFIYPGKFAGLLGVRRVRYKSQERMSRIGAGLLVRGVGEHMIICPVVFHDKRTKCGTDNDDNRYLDDHFHTLSLSFQYLAIPHEIRRTLSSVIKLPPLADYKSLVIAPCRDFIVPPSCLVPFIPPGSHPSLPPPPVCQARQCTLFKPCAARRRAMAGL
jgi:hypothetical protein